MTISYVYTSERYDTEADAQSAAEALSVRMQNNPTEWMTAKEITGSNETGWTFTPTTLTDAELLSPDDGKTYMCYSVIIGNNEFPLTATELAEKRDEYRGYYAEAFFIDCVKMFDDETDTRTDIPTNVDMSGYV